MNLPNAQPLHELPSKLMCTHVKGTRGRHPKGKTKQRKKKKKKAMGAGFSNDKRLQILKEWHFGVSNAPIPMSEGLEKKVGTGQVLPLAQGRHVSK